MPREEEGIGGGPWVCFIFWVFSDGKKGVFLVTVEVRLGVLWGSGWGSYW